MEKMYETPAYGIIEIKLVGMLCASDGTNVSEEDYENIGGSGNPGAIAE